MEFQSVFSILCSTNAKLICTGLCGLAILYYLCSDRRRPSRPATHFGAFLLEDTSQKPPVEFSAFLKDSAVIPSQSGSQSGREAAPEGAISVPILYATEYGFSKEIAELLGEKMKASSVYWLRACRSVRF